MSAEFVANMEDLLDLYAEPYDPRRPVVCFDETSTQLLADTRPSLPSRPGIPLRQDYEYRREGVRNLFLTCEPLAGWRHVAVTQRRTMEDFAHQMRWLVDEAYPDTPVVRVVMDNLNTHRPASLYETFPAPEARRIAKRLEFHYTPKHGSWLNMAEIEFSVLSRSCLKQRLPDEEALRREVHALVKSRVASWTPVSNSKSSILSRAPVGPRKLRLPYWVRSLDTGWCVVVTNMAFLPCRTASAII